MAKPTSLLRLLLVALPLCACSDKAPTVGPTGEIIDACGMHRADPGLLVTTLAGPAGAAYDGLAVVERNTTLELVLAFSPSAIDASGGPSTLSLPFHVSIFGLGASARFQPGAKVWLTKDPAGNSLAPIRSGGSAGSLNQSLAVYDRHGGRLLFASANDADAGLATVSGARSCTAAYDDGCSSGRITYRSLEVQGDSAVMVQDGETKVVPVGGFDYDVAVTSRRLDVSDTGRCSDAGSGGSWRKMDVTARDLAILAAGLEVGEPLACARGNEERMESQFSLYNVDGQTPYDGPVVYVKRREAGDDDCFAFDTPALAAQGAMPPVLELCATRGLVTEFAVGQSLWVSMPPVGLSGTLRTAEHGAVLLANAWTGGDFAGSASLIGQALGVRAVARPRCPYAPPAAVNDTTPSYLSEMIFATDPPAVLSSDGHVIVPIDGKDFDVWLSSDASITAVAR